MRWIRTLWRNLAQRPRIDDDLDRELRSYESLLEDEKARAGVDPRDARRAALLELGGREQIKEEVRDVRIGATLAAIASELRQSLRAMRRNPAMTILGTLMLALGMAASTVVFSIFYATLLRPLPFRDPDRLVQLWETRLDRGWSEASFTEANFWDVRSRNQSFEEVGAYHYGDANLTGDGSAEKVTCAPVSASFFRTLGISPILGRDFAYDEGADSASRVVILGHRFWTTRFGADPNILGRTLRLDDRPHTVIGVLPPGNAWLTDQTYVPFVYRFPANRTSFEYNVVGRLKAGVSPEVARADLQRIAGALAETYPREAKGIGFRFGPSSDWRAGETTRLALRVLLAAVSFLLLIGCLNIANLLLARGMSRRREIAVRTALGAGRAPLVRYVMMESLLLSGFGAALGVSIAFGALRGLQSLEICGIPRLEDAGINLWVLGFAIAIALGTGILSGLAPALQTPASGIAAALREGDRQTGSRGQWRLRTALVTVEVALSFLLLIGAGLLIRSFSQLLTANRGFQTGNRLVFSVSMPNGYWERGVGKQFLDRFFERLSSSPEVVAVGAVNTRPVEGGNPGMGIVSAAQQQLAGSDIPWAGWRVITPRYFHALGLPLLKGRVFDETDRPVWIPRGEAAYQRRVIVSERLAKLLYPSEDPIGKHALLWRGQANMDAEIVGVVGDMRERGLNVGPTLTVYLPYGSQALPSEFIVHTRGNPAAFMPTVRSIVSSLDPNLPVSDARSMEEVVHRSVAPQRFNTILLGVFSALALLLATTGIYGVLSYSISRRTSEIGLRVALGATGSSILKMAVLQGMRPVAVGLFLGGIGAVWLSRYFATLLFGVRPLDAITYAGVAALLVAAALLACYIPGRRATRIDPAIALRVE
jgi:putative ABC transport system permease protein